jgi:predicted MFS family arabinose efflux permease
MAPFVGSISDLLGRKRLIVAACSVLVIPTLLIATAASLEAMIAWRFVQGLMLPFIFTVTVAYIGDECPGPDGIRAAGVYAIGTILGGFLGRFVAGIAADDAGWRFAFVVMAAATALSAMAVAVLLPPEKKFVATSGGLRGSLRAYREHFGNPRVLATCVVGFGMLFAMVGAFTYVNFLLAAPPFLLTTSQLGLVFAVYLLGAVTTPVASAAAVRFGRRPTLALMASLALAGLLLALVESLPAVVAGLALVAAGLFMVQTLSLQFIAVTVARARSTAVGMYVTSYYIGGALGGIAPSALWRLAGWPGVIALLATVVLLLMAVALTWWRERPATA